MRWVPIILAICIIGVASWAAGPAETQPSSPLFNGHDLSGWNIPDPNLYWKASDGVMVGNASAGTKDADLFTQRKDFKDLEFETEYRCLAEADSGVDIRGAIQVQIGISSKLKIDKTASIYQEHPSGGYVGDAGDVSKFLKPGDWNKLRFIARGNNIKVWLNDQQVIDFDISKYPNAGPIGLQLHSGAKNKIEFRNMNVRELK